MQLSIIRLAWNGFDANSPWSKAAAGAALSHLDSAHVSLLSLFFILLFYPPSLFLPSLFCFFLIPTVSCRLNYLWFQLANKIPHDITQFFGGNEAWLIWIWSNICMCLPVKENSLHILSLPLWNTPGQNEQLGKCHLTTSPNKWSMFFSTPTARTIPLFIFWSPEVNIGQVIVFFLFPH